MPFRIFNIVRFTWHENEPQVFLWIFSQSYSIAPHSKTFHSHRWLYLPRSQLIQIQLKKINKIPINMSIVHIYESSVKTLIRVQRCISEFHAPPNDIFLFHFNPATIHKTKLDKQTRRSLVDGYTLMMSPQWNALRRMLITLHLKPRKYFSVLYICGLRTVWMNWQHWQSMLITLVVAWIRFEEYRCSRGVSVCELIPNLVGIYECQVSNVCVRMLIKCNPKQYKLARLYKYTYMYCGNQNVCMSLVCIFMECVHENLYKLCIYHVSL